MLHGAYINYAYNSSYIAYSFTSKFFKLRLVLFLATSLL
jgi:hypothetical protein